MRPHPLLYEASARLLLNRLSAAAGRPLTLATAPAEGWERLAAQGFDLLWLMGVWRRSPAARARALAHPGLRDAFDQALPGWEEPDVGGSPYAVADYALDPSLGKEGDLALLRERLHRAGLGLVLDFVPNHLASDHPWTLDHPEYFLHAESREAAQEHPGWFFETPGGGWIAHGRDPNFPSWDDTVQLNHFSAGARDALINELLRIAEVADGVRCDMAMLVLTEVFEHVWGRFLPSDARPATEFWSDAIARVRLRHPGFLFIAEAYWGSETRLLELGFDHVYDKGLYDSLLRCDAAGARARLSARPEHAARWVRFIENHDEARAVSAFGRDRSLGAAVATLTLPGLRFLHDGQIEGKRVRLPVQLQREPEEPGDAEVSAFYGLLLAELRDPLFREGAWSLLDIEPADGGSGRTEHLLAWCWRYGDEAALIAANLDGATDIFRLRLPPNVPPAARRFRRALPAPADAPAVTVTPDGWLVLALRPWEAAIFRTF